VAKFETYGGDRARLCDGDHITDEYLVAPSRMSSAIGHFMSEAMIM
jgi:hypothetical protein